MLGRNTRATPTKPASTAAKASPAAARPAKTAPAQQEEGHPHRGHVVERHRRGQRQAAQGKEPHQRATDADRAAPHVHAGHGGAQADAPASAPRRRPSGVRRRGCGTMTISVASYIDDASFTQTPMAANSKARRAPGAAAPTRSVSEAQLGPVPLMEVLHAVFHGALIGTDLVCRRGRTGARRPASMRSAISSSSMQVSM